nr:MAG TPA: hypothetical protein [Caudoviricetes sp.]
MTLQSVASAMLDNTLTTDHQHTDNTQSTNR